jgi:HAD superfamily hydrolase (TIGR01490 family)
MQKIAFYDLDGTLLDANVIHAYAYYALSVPNLGNKLSRTIKLVASLPLYAWADKKGRKLFNDLFYQNYKGIGEDRLWVLGEEMFETFLKNRIYQEQIELIKRSKQEGYQQVLVTGALDSIAAPIAKYLGMDDWVANRLEFLEGEATGNLIPPIFAGPEKAYWMQSYAQSKGVDLKQCRAYADSASDIPMLTIVGYPVAVNPDDQLKATADAHNWPIIWAK